MFPEDSSYISQAIFSINLYINAIILSSKLIFMMTDIKLHIDSSVFRKNSNPSRCWIIDHDSNTCIHTSKLHVLVSESVGAACLAFASYEKQ